MMTGLTFAPLVSSLQAAVGWFAVLVTAAPSSPWADLTRRDLSSNVTCVAPEPLAVSFAGELSISTNYTISISASAASSVAGFATSSFQLDIVNSVGSLILNNCTSAEDVYAVQVVDALNLGREDSWQYVFWGRNAKALVYGYAETYQNASVVEHVWLADTLGFAGEYELSAADATAAGPARVTRSIAPQTVSLDLSGAFQVQPYTKVCPTIAGADVAVAEDCTGFIESYDLVVFNAARDDCDELLMQMVLTNGNYSCVARTDVAPQLNGYFAGVLAAYCFPAQSAPAGECDDRQIDGVAEAARLNSLVAGLSITLPAWWNASTPSNGP